MDKFGFDSAGHAGKVLVHALTALPHDVDVKALTRLATLYNIPLAINHATADAVLAAL